MTGRVIVGLLLSVVLSIYSAPTKDDLLELSIIHLNDFHARFEEISPSSGACKSDNCIGGFSRVYAAVTNLVKERPNAIFLNGGDNFQGTLWYSLFRWNVTQHFVNKLPTDAYTLGNHEFDHKIAGVVPFIKSLNAPVLVANIDASEEPDLQKILKKSTVITRNGKKIGIIGVIANNTNELSSTEKLKFTGEAAAVNEEAKKLVETEGCKIIIVLSHAGINVDQEMAKQVSSHVNLIVGSHSHTFLYSGKPPGPDKPAGPYPIVVEREEGRKVLVVQAAAYTKYVGNLTVWYNDSGDIVNWEGNPIYMDKNAPQDPKINEEISMWKEKVDQYGNRVLGVTNVVLSNNNCYEKECNLGNFIADAMVDAFVSRAESDAWTYAAIAVTNAGGIRSTIPKGNITYNDLVTTAPFESTVDVGELKGQYIKDFLELSAGRPNHRFQKFLQVSGMQIVFDFQKPPGLRVAQLKIICRKCAIPQFEDFKPDEMYRIIMPSYIANGGDGYSIIRDNLQNRLIGDIDIDVIEAYIKKMSPITQGLNNRIVVIS